MLTDPYRCYVLQISMPHGRKTLGMGFERKNHKSNIACMLCNTYFAKTEEELIRHILKAHPREGHFLKMMSWKQMII
jgi:hypothetical protein